MIRPVVIVGDSVSSTMFGLRWLNLGVDLIKRPKSVYLLQFGILKSSKVCFIAYTPSKPNPSPTFLLSWAWKGNFIFKGRIMYGTTTKPIQIIRRSNELRVRRRSNKTRQIGQ